MDNNQQEPSTQPVEQPIAQNYPQPVALQPTVAGQGSGINKYLPWAIIGAIVIMALPIIVAILMSNNTTATNKSQPIEQIKEVSRLQAAKLQLESGIDQFANSFDHDYPDSVDASNLERYLLAYNKTLERLKTGDIGKDQKAKELFDKMLEEDAVVIKIASSFVKHSPDLSGLKSKCDTSKLSSEIPLNTDTETKYREKLEPCLSILNQLAEDKDNEPLAKYGRAKAADQEADIKKRGDYGRRIAAGDNIGVALDIAGTITESLNAVTSLQESMDSIDGSGYTPSDDDLAGNIRDIETSDEAGYELITYLQNKMSPYSQMPAL